MIFEDIYQKKILKNQVREKNELTFLKNGKNELEINIIVVRKLNYMEIDAELDSRWSILMDFDGFFQLDSR